MTTTKTRTEEETAVFFRFLDSLRDSGIVNMFGAAPTLSEVFGLSRAEARSVLRLWMETFASRHPEGRS